MKVRIYPAAQIRLLEIWEYTFNTWDEAQADEYLFGLTAFFDQLAARKIPWRRIDGRKFERVRFARFQHHYVFFRELEDGLIGILTVLHEAMDLPNRLRDDLR